jgi:hypothetical protein
MVPACESPSGTPANEQLDPAGGGSPGPVVDACDDTLCGDDCVDLFTSCEHCGACNNACSEDEICCDGELVHRIGGSGEPLVSEGPCGSLIYNQYANQGQTDAVNTVADFSFAGYRRGGVAIPDAPVRETVSPGAGDDRARIQAAIDAVGQLPLDSSGLRGAVLLTKGTYEVSDTLDITESGVVLRGEGQGTDGTILLATRTAQHSLIHIHGSGSGLGEVEGTRVPITTPYVPVGSRSFEVESAAGYAPGDAIAVLRTPNQTWIDALGMGTYGWTVSSYTIGHERTVTEVIDSRIVVDIPIVDTMEAQYGGGAVFATNVAGRIEDCGVEDLRLDSVYSSSTDENHGWTGVRLDRVVNSWVRRVTVEHFGYEAVGINGQSNFNTVEEVAMINPISEIAGSRRYPFHVSNGIGNLFQRCYARDGRHNFATGARVTGPNVWLDCLGENNHADDGPHHRWATGLLLDNTKSTSLRVHNRKTSGTGHGWAGAQTLFWNGAASDVVCDAPEGAMNWTIGSQGTKTESPYSPEEPDGWWESHGSQVTPRSLYLAQLAARLGPAAVDAVTSEAQRQGRIWTMLQEWAGEGLLERYGPDPTCQYGIAAGSICCAASCGTCGGTGCSQLPGGAASCCMGIIAESGRSCNDYPAPCILP